MYSESCMLGNKIVAGQDRHLSTWRPMKTGPSVKGRSEANTSTSSSTSGTVPPMPAAAVMLNGEHAARRAWLMFLCRKRKGIRIRGQATNERLKRHDTHAVGSYVKRQQIDGPTEGGKERRMYVHSVFRKRSQKVLLGDRLFKQPPTKCGLACSRQTVHDTTQAAHDEQSQRLNNHPDAARRRQADDAKTRDLI